MAEDSQDHGLEALHNELVVSKPIYYNNKMIKRYFPYQRSHASCFRLLASSLRDLASDFVVQGQDVLDNRRVLDPSTGHLVLRRVQVVRTIGTETLKHKTITFCFVKISDIYFAFRRRSILLFF